MPVLSFGIMWVGYAVLAWGLGTVRGCNVTFTQVAWPGKWTGCSPDTGGGGTVDNISLPNGGTAGVSTKTGTIVVNGKAGGVQP